MLVSDLLHSCANDCVAEAAVSSIGGSFASRIGAVAADDGVSVGFFTSKIVREFAIAATEGEWRDLVVAVRGQDHPVLAGLERIVLRKLSKASPGAEFRESMATHLMSSSMAVA